MKMSKSDFKARALEIFRKLEANEETLILTDHGKPRILLKKVREQGRSPLEILKGSVIKYSMATSPVADNDRENG